MSKKIAVVYYSQSGQLKKIAENFVKPFMEAGMSVEMLPIRPKTDFPFPWSSEAFFNVMPESVLGIPTELLPMEFKHTSYDLIVLAYQPWYLSPSIPATSILHDPEFKKRLANTPVITLIGGRNMWINAQERVKRLLKSNGASLVGNIALRDKHANLISAITIQYWMFTGKKDRLLGILPKPGISDKDIDSVHLFGAKASEALLNGSLTNLQKKLIEMKAVEVKSNLMFIESRAPKLFSIWANIIVKKNNRPLWLQLFKYYLMFALFIVSPVVLLINMLFLRPFTGKRVQKKKSYYSGIN